MKSQLPSSDPMRLFKSAALLVSAAFLLSACQDPDRLINDDPENPANRALGSELADPGLTWLVIGDRLMAANEFDAALKAYFRAANDDGLTVVTLGAIGSAQAKLGRLGQAEETFRKALEMDERSVVVWNNLGIVLYGSGETGEAREAFKTAFALDNGASPEIRENLNFLSDKLDNFTLEEPELTEFRLVNRGNGRYLLLGNN